MRVNHEKAGFKRPCGFPIATIIFTGMDINKQINENKQLSSDPKGLLPLYMG